MIDLEKVRALPCEYRITIPPEYLDVLGHMNVRWYMGIADEGAWNFFASLGINLEYFEKQESGVFNLAIHTRYLAEVRLGETVTMHCRVLGRSEKRIHFMAFLVNETTQKLAATFEGLGSHADLTARRTSPFPPHIAANIDARLAHDQPHDWEAPMCGVLHP